MSDDQPTPPQQPTPPEQPWGTPPEGAQSGPSGPPSGAGWQHRNPPPGGQGWQQPPAGQPPYNYGPPAPPENKSRFGRGCVFGCLGAVVGVVALVVVLILVFAGTSSKTDIPSVTNSDHPPADDVRITACEVDSSAGIPTAKLEITNHSSKRSSYIITVEFDKPDGTRVSEGATGSTSVASGQKVQTSAAGLGQVSGTITCKVTNVNRFAS
ncbi:hypothetical protein ACIGXA_36725 [Streptomyces fildesensis]|uniref:Uncharacterized protein n=1 Tax=Streptomyces fildesensis TaxID=375757 RepID=A0ABW8CI11_9ACTN